MACAERADGHMIRQVLITRLYDWRPVAGLASVWEDPCQRDENR